MRLTITVQADNKNTIYEVLKHKLGREPSTAELRAEVSRILSKS